MDIRHEIRQWLAEHLPGSIGTLDERLQWERTLADGGWNCVGWPVEYGGRGLTLEQQMAVHEEYALSGAPPRIAVVGEELLGPTLMAFGTEAQRARFLPRIRSGEEQWCQGYSEPGAGSDLANVSTGATLDGDRWLINGQKIWTSWAHISDWAFVLARTTPGSHRHTGLSYLLVPMRQPGVTVRPIRQLTGTSEFNEVFFDNATTEPDLVVGSVGDGWKVAMATLGFERGVAMLGHQVRFRRELDGIIALARANGTIDDPLIRDRLTRAWIGLETMRAYTLTGDSQPSVAKLLWGSWHRGLGELAMDVIGASSTTVDGDALSEWQHLYLFSRAETIYGGSDEIQRNIIAHRHLSLPRPS
ncbi:acyl-CoA dehydrogenase family protein, partial [Allorhizocola rhizosphaerae]|uniref:acyl-CoA dehydrogenase family protein n=1 Tax=Allorhizocola rhizosphaerae TaxID=1872709 RepID=UPI003CCC791E